MSEDKYAALDHEDFKKLAESLKGLPQYLEEKRRKAEERKEFCQRVFEKACRKAGLLDRKLC